MDTLTPDIISVLQYLLPGFVTAWIFYAFTSYLRPSNFERVVQALIFTLIVQVITYFTKEVLLFIGHYWFVAKWSESSNLIWALTISILLGFVISYYSNNDKFHKYLRDKGITRETSYASEWFGAFLKNITYVVLHLEDGRRLYGWPIEWPTDPQNGHFVLEQASWLDDENEIELTKVNQVLVDASKVQLVEFMEKTWEKKNE